MNATQQLEIAIKLLEAEITMHAIRYSTDESLMHLAQHRVNVDFVDLQAFAEEVANRSESWKALEQQERQELSQTILLLTDDHSVETENMRPGTVNNVPLPEIRAILNAGYNVYIRIRDADVAARLNQTLAKKIQTTTRPLPKLRRNDIVLSIISNQTIDNEMLVLKSLYKP